MEPSIYFAAVILILFLAILDRLREASSFWFTRSVFFMLPDKFKKWFNPDDRLEYRKIEIFGHVIKLHPIFWDGYHFAKNFSVLLFLLFLGYYINWSLLLFGALVWFIGQYLGYRFFITKGKYNG